MEATIDGRVFKYTTIRRRTRTINKVLVRLLTMIENLRARPMTREMLFSEFGMSERVTSRDLASIEAAGLPLTCYTDDHGETWYRIVDRKTVYRWADS